MTPSDSIFPFLALKDKLYRFAFRIVGLRAEAEDVVQEVYLKIWDKRNDLDGLKNPEAWCMTLTKNVSLDKLRSKHKRAEELSDTVLKTQASVHPGKQYEVSDAVQSIKRLMNELPENYRMVMHLRDIEQMSYDEISIILSIPLPQVKVNLHRARSAIRQQMTCLENFGL